MAINNNPTVTLTSYNLGGNATDADYASWIGYVAAKIDDACKFEVNVDSARFGAGPAEDAIAGATDEQAETIREALSALWESGCADGFKIMANITHAQIAKLSIEAGEHGDLEQVKICEAALAGDTAAAAECARVIAAARAQA